MAMVYGVALTTGLSCAHPAWLLMLCRPELGTIGVLGWKIVSFLAALLVRAGCSEIGTRRPASGSAQGSAMRLSVLYLIVLLCVANATPPRVTKAAYLQKSGYHAAFNLELMQYELTADQDVRSEPMAFFLRAHLPLGFGLGTGGIRGVRLRLRVRLGLKVCGGTLARCPLGRSVALFELLHSFDGLPEVMKLLGSSSGGDAG